MLKPPQNSICRLGPCNPAKRHETCSRSLNQFIHFRCLQIGLESLAATLCKFGRRSWRVGVVLADTAGQKPFLYSHHTLSDLPPKPLTTVPPGASLPPSSKYFVPKTAIFQTLRFCLRGLLPLDIRRSCNSPVLPCPRSPGYRWSRPSITVYFLFSVRLQ